MTGTRADYGLMRQLLICLDNSEQFSLSICVTGMHLSSLYGNTVEEIKSDGFKLCGLIPVSIEEATGSEMVRSIGHEILGMSEVFHKEQPDLILLLGDRGEMMAAALTAVHLNIPIVHLHGGERSGTVDEMIRHAISKFSHYHFVATENARQRLIRMGEHAHTIFVVGAPGLDELIQFNPCSAEEFRKNYDLSAKKRCGLMVFHPVVQEYDVIKSQFKHIIEAALSQDLQLLALEPNSDAGGHLIRDVLEDYKSHPDIRVIKHLHRFEYINCLAHVDLMLGNSSSGIIEAATFNLPVVNVGCRQNLRERSGNVIDVDPNFNAVASGVATALENKGQVYINNYGDGQTSKRCVGLLSTISLGPQILHKYNAY